MTSAKRIVVVGASLGGLRAAEQLRAAGFEGEIRVVGDEVHLPYNRPPLSKDVLADEGDNDPVRLHGSLAFRRRPSTDDVDFILGKRAIGSDLEKREISFHDGSTEPFDGLVVATGLRARRLRVPGPQRGRFSIRTLDDAIGLREVVREDPAVVIVGGGFVGVETAATLRKLGLNVTVVTSDSVSQSRVLGPALGASIQRHLEAAGVRFVVGQSVVRTLGEDRVSGVELADGSHLAGHAVIEAVGSICNVDWLADSSLDVTDGVLCDNRLSALGADAVVAVGDIARFPNPLFDDIPRRVEHWSMPTDTAKRAAATLAAEMAGQSAPRTVFAPLPSFWSDQLDLRLQAYGSPILGSEMRVEEGTLDDPAGGLLATYHREGGHVGSVAVNLPPTRLREIRQSLAGTPSLPEAIAGRIPQPSPPSHRKEK